GPDERVNFTRPYLVNIHPLVDDRRLLKEDLPRRNGGTNICHDQSQHSHGSEAPGEPEVRIQETFADSQPAAGDIPSSHSPECCGYINKIEQAEKQSDFFECPVSAGDHDAKKEQCNAEERDPFRNVEQAHCLRHSDILRDERQPVDKRQIKNREPAPELSKAIEDCFRVASLRDCTEAHRHFLNIVRHRDQDNKCPEQTEPALRTSLRISGDTARVVISDHTDNTWA